MICHTCARPLSMGSYRYAKDSDGAKHKLCLGCKEAYWMGFKAGRGQGEEIGYTLGHADGVVGTTDRPVSER